MKKKVFTIKDYQTIVTETAGGYIAKLVEIPQVEAVAATEKEAIKNLKHAFKSYKKENGTMPLPKVILKSIFTDKPLEPAGGYFDLPCLCKCGFPYSCPRHEG